MWRQWRCSLRWCSPWPAKLGLHPVAFTLFVCNTDTFAYVLPTQITAAVIAYGTETFTTSDYAKVGSVSILLAILFSLCGNCAVVCPLGLARLECLSGMALLTLFPHLMRSSYEGATHEITTIDQSH